MKAKGIFVGLSTIDIIYTVAEHPAPNKKIAAESQQIIVGGPATNAAITFAFLGGRTTLVAPVGRHSLANVVREECSHSGIELIDLAPDSQDPPPMSSVWVDSEGQRSVISANAAGRIIPAAVADHERLAGASILMVDGHAMQACKTWAEAARSAGTLVVLDGGSWKPGTDAMLRNVDVAICSADFLPPGCATEDEVIDCLLASGVHSIAITHGASPIRFVSDSGSGFIDVPRVECVDTTGAGDIFHGAFCFHRANGCTVQDALQRAAIVASESCRYRGTRQWMQEHSEASSIPPD
ncbi:MAG: sugar kinase [Acidobacteria bacterium]|nr:sugar kinase [Acidobacteriota bacterium]